MSIDRPTISSRFPAGIPLATARTTRGRNKNISLREMHPYKIADMASAAADCGFHNLSDMLYRESDIQADKLGDYLDEYDR